MFQVRGRHVGVQKLYTNMAAPYKRLLNLLKTNNCYFAKIKARESKNGSSTNVNVLFRVLESKM